MSDVTVKLKWDGELRFTATNVKGIETVLDGRTQSGASPVEILLEAVGACTSIDVVLIMEKMREPLHKLEVVVGGDRNATEPKYFTGLHVRFDAWGDGIHPEKLERAIALSFSKYCSVYHSLRADLRTQVEYRIHTVGISSNEEVTGDYRIIEVGTPIGPA